MGVDHITPKKKRCTQCGKHKVLPAFSRQSAGRNGLRAWCRECVTAWCAAWYAKPENKARHNATCAAYRARPEIRKRRAAYQARPKWKTAARAYYYTPRGKATFVANARRRRMRKLRARPIWVDESALNSIYAECAQRRRNGERVVVDHFWPLRPRNRQFSGLDVPWNLRVISAVENGSGQKHDQRPDVFYSPREFRRITRQLDRCAARLRG